MLTAQSLHSMLRTAAVHPMPDRALARDGTTEWRARTGASLKMPLRDLHLTFLVEVGRGEPSVVVERHPRDREDRAVVDDPRRAIHAQA